MEMDKKCRAVLAELYSYIDDYVSFDDMVGDLFDEIEFAIKMAYVVGYNAGVENQKYNADNS